MTQPVVFLLFEDNHAHAELIVLSMAEHARDEDHIEVVWFDGPFGKQISGLNSPDPYSISRPRQEITIKKKAIERNPPRKDHWWQCEFDAAILDIRDQRSSTSAGYDFATWLERALFQGSVVFASIDPLDTGRFPRLKHRFVSKKQEDTQWTRDVSIPLLPFTRLPEPRVNYIGRAPDTLLADYFRTVRGKRRWYCAHFGKDHVLAAKVHAFFSIDSFDDQHVHDMDSLESVEQGPELVVVDCEATGGCLNDATVRLMDPVAKWTTQPITLFLTNKEEMIDPRLLGTLNAAIVNRDQFKKFPSHWAHAAIETLAVRYEHYQQASGSEWRPAARKLFEAVHGPVAMARSLHKLAGTGLPLSSWVAGPEAPRLKKYFSSEFGKLVHRLSENGDIAESQSRFYVK